MEEKRKSLPFYQLDRNGLSRTRRKLAWTFARVFDYSYVKSVCYELYQQRPQPGLEFLGDGAHAYTYRLFTGKDMDLAVSLVKPSFLRTLMHGSETWPKLMDQVSRLDHPLIPPFVIVQEHEHWLAYIRPYCPQTVDELSPEIQQGIEELKLSLQDELRDKELILDDYLQIRACDNHPFIVDWSDLGRIKRRA